MYFLAMYACPYFVKVTYAMHGQSHEIIREIAANMDP